MNGASARVGAFLSLLASGAAAQEQPLWLTVNELAPAREHAGKYLAAWRDHDEAAMDALAAATRPDPFIVADEILGRADSPSPAASGAIEELLDVAASFAKRAHGNVAAEGLAALVEQWRTLELEDFERDARLRALRRRLDAARASQQTGEDLRVAADAEADLVKARCSVAAVSLRLDVGDALLDRGEIEGAERQLEPARAAAVAMAWPGAEAEACVQLGNVFGTRGRLREADASYGRAVELLDRRAEHGTVVELTVRLANVANHLSEYERALERACRVLSWCEGLDDRRTFARALREAGSACDGLFRYDEGAGYLRRAVVAYEGLQDRAGAAISRSNLARALLFLGDYGAALSESELAVREFEALKHSFYSAAARMVLAATQCELRQWEAARSNYERSLQVFEERRDRGFTLTALGGLARCWSRLGDMERALGFYERAYAEQKELGLRSESANTLADIGELRGVRGQAERARECLESALSQQLALGDRRSAARTRTRLSSQLERMQKYSEALEVEQDALREKVEQNDGLGEVNSLRRIAGILSGSGRAEEAIGFARQSVERANSLGRALGEQDASGLRGDAREGALTGLDAAHRSLRQVSVDRDARLRDALWFVESARATLLAEALQNRDALLATGVPEELREAESAARGVVAERQQQLTALSGRRGVPPPELAAARKSLDDAYHDLETAIGRIQRDARRVAEICYPEPIDLDSLRAAIPEDATLLLYACRWDHPFVLALSHDGVELVRLGESDALLATAREYVGLAATPGSDDTRLAADLYEQLLRPLEEQLGTRTRLIVSPDESFALVPFEALLRVEGESRERALERFEISYVPSGTVYATLVAQSRGVPRGERLVALGDPVYPGEAAWAAAGSEGTVVAAVLRDLELRGLGRLARLAASGEEVRAIGAMFPAGSRTLLVREGATKAALLVALAQPGPRVASLHLACHGHVDADHPRLTGVVFTGGEILTVDDVFAAKLPADLVVLSACETGGGKVFKGEGVFGLVRACFFAGAPRVVVTNWSVVDESTRALMVRFYEGMWKERRSAAAALRAAKLSALAGGGAGAHPSRWAGFVLWGLDD